MTPGRNVGIEEQEDDEEPCEEKVQRLTSELSGMFAKSHELEDEIRKKLEAKLGMKFEKFTLQDLALIKHGKNQKKVASADGKITI